ncbi:MAG TPA: hypothetical protein VD969_20035 [Symbiobacteriaceae bacterium]|nr:hypothetical protein [Symbiobacteriaceae bacterium]
MTRILVDPEDLSSLAALLRRRSDDLRNVGWDISCAVSTLTWEVRERTQVEDYTYLATRSARDLSEHLEEMAAFLAAKGDAFSDADRTAVEMAIIRSRVERIWQMVESVVPGWLVPDFPGRALVGLGTLGVAGYEALSHIPLLAVDQFLRGTTGRGLNEGVTQADYIAGLAAVVGVKRKRWGSEEKEGWTAGYWQAHASLMDSDAEFDALHYEKNLGHGTEVEANAGHFSANLKAFRTDRMGFDGGLEADIEGNVLQAEVSQKLYGTDDVNFGAEAGAKVLGVEVEGSIGLDGIELEAMAYGVQAEAGLQLNVFDWSVTIGLRGCAACAGASAHLTTGEGELGVGAGLGLSVFWDVDAK